MRPKLQAQNDHWEGLGSLSTCLVQRRVAERTIEAGSSPSPACIPCWSGFKRR